MTDEEREIQWIADRESERISSMLTKDRRVSDPEMSKIAQKAALFDRLFTSLAYWVPSQEPLTSQRDIPSIIHKNNWNEAQAIFVLCRELQK